MSRHTSTLVDIALATGLVVAALFTIIELVRVAGMMQLDGIFGWS
jgi:hypothetical protein